MFPSASIVVSGAEFIVHQIYIQVISDGIGQQQLKVVQFGMLSEEDLLNEIRLYKTKVIVTQTELQNFINYLDQVVFKRFHCFCSPWKATMAPSFQRAFKALTDYEQADYYLTCLKVIEEINLNRCSTEQAQQGHERLELQYRQDKKLWKMTTAILSYKQTILELESLGIKMKLENYLMRMSQGRKKEAFVLESTRADCQPVTIRLSHSDSTQYWRLLGKMRQLILDGLRKKIEKMKGLRDSKQLVDTFQRKKICLSLQFTKAIQEDRKSLRQLLDATMISQDSRPKSISQDQIEKQLIESQIIENLDNFKNYEQVQKGLYVHQSKQKIRKLCVFEGRKMSLSWLLDEFINEQHFKRWKSSLCSIFVIADVPKERTKFYHEINIYKDGNEVDYVYLRNRFERNGVTYFVDKSISSLEYGSHQTSSSRGNIEYILWRITLTSVNTIEILVEAEINHLPCVDICEAMSEQIGEIENIVLCRGMQKKTRNLEVSDIQFYSIMNEGDFSSGSEWKEQTYQAVCASAVHTSERMSIESDFYSIVNVVESVSNLTVQSVSSNPEFRFQLFPTNPSQKVYKQFKNDLFFDREECVTNEIGDLVFTNKDKIKAQGGIIIKMFKRIGAHLLTGKNVLNVSFPIEIFGTDTNLERLCKGMAYAPHFLENKIGVTPLQRMKAAICFAIGNLLLYIDMEKPFNPILGQTYQGFIDGCPLYGQQTSHHPPISSLFLVGRDYFVSANIEATVELNMNSVSGSNSGQYRIAFNRKDPNKDVVIFTSPPGQLSGIIYGQRKLNIIEKSRFYDPQNKLFCELHWGHTKSKTTVCRYHDYVEGKIVELGRQCSSIDKVKESEKDRVLGHITGRWTETIYFNGETIFQVNKIRPFKVIDQRVPLQSDSRFRLDKQFVEKRMFAEAQSAKQSLQQIQRNDRKLRKELSK